MSASQLPGWWRRRAAPDAPTIAPGAIDGQRSSTPMFTATEPATAATQDAGDAGGVRGEEGDGAVSNEMPAEGDLRPSGPVSPTFGPVSSAETMTGPSVAGDLRQRRDRPRG